MKYLLIGIEKFSSQSDSFKTISKRLKCDEIMLYDNITTLDSFSNFTENAAFEYSTVNGAIEAISKQQKSLMSSLDKIEENLDEVLRERNQQFRYNSLLSGGSNNHMRRFEGENWRQQLDFKSHILNGTLDQLEDTVHSLSKTISINESEDREDEGESKSFDRILNQSYESLIWIQDTITELTCHIEYIEKEQIQDNK